MGIKKWRLLAAATAVLMVGAGCSSSKSNGGSALGHAPAQGHTYSLGVLVDLTGGAASANKSTVQGVQAGIALATNEGYHIKMVVADTASSPSQTLVGAQRLVESDHVFAVIEVCAFGFAATPFLTSHGIPVLGAAADPSWITNKNMFSVWGPLDQSKVATTFGEFFKLLGAANLGEVGYSISASAVAAKGIAESAQHAGVKVGYFNDTFPLGSTNVGPEVLQMKAARVDALNGTVVPATVFALAAGLKQEGVNLRVILMPTGYGADLAEGGPDALVAAQRMYFSTEFEPLEMKTAATKQFQSALSTLGVKGDPGGAAYIGYAAVDLFVRGLQAAGANPTQPAFISALAGVKDFDAWGLLGSHPLNLGQRNGIVNGPGNCIYFVQYVGSVFNLVKGATPLCGETIPGVKVSTNQ